MDMREGFFVSDEGVTSGRGTPPETKFSVPVTEVEVPPIADSLEPTFRTLLEALVETIRDRKRR